LYCNLSDTKVNGKKAICEPILELTSTKLKGKINSNSSPKEFDSFITKNSLSTVHLKLITTLFSEAKSNKFTISIKEVK